MNWFCHGTADFCTSLLAHQISVKTRPTAIAVSFKKPE